MEAFVSRHYGSNFIVDILRQYGISYTAFNPGASFRGIHDSLINYPGNEKPKFPKCTHEEISVAIAQEYARAASANACLLFTVSPKFLS